MSLSRTLSSNYSDLDSSELTLLLNDDCLLKIFEYLSLYDQISLMTISKRFSNVFLLYSMSHKKLHAQFHNNSTKKIPWMENNYLIELIQILPFEKLKILRSLDEDYLIKILLQAQNLPNLSYLQIINNRITMLPRYGNLSELILRSCSLDDDFIKTLSENQKTLEHLDLSNNKNLLGDHLKQFQKLDTLILKHCTKIKEKNLIDIFKNNLNLKHINVEYCKNFGISAFNELPSDIISLSFCYNNENKYLNFSNKIFPNLTRLEIGRSDDSIIEIHRKLKTLKSPNIQVMKICFNQENEIEYFWSNLLKNTIAFDNISHFILNLPMIQSQLLNELDWGDFKKISTLKSVKLILYRELYRSRFAPKSNSNEMIKFIQQTSFLENFEIYYQNIRPKSNCDSVLVLIESLLMEKFKPTVIFKCLLNNRILHLLCKCSASNKKKMIITVYNDFTANPLEKFWIGIIEFIRKNQHNIQELHIKYYAQKHFIELDQLIEELNREKIDIKIEIEVFSTKELLDKFMKTIFYTNTRSRYNLKIYDDLSYKTIDEIFFENDEYDKTYSLEIS